MSCYVIYYENGAKMMRPVLTAEEYRNLRDTEKQKQIVCSVRNGNEKLKHRLLQMNYSCLPARTTDNRQQSTDGHAALDIPAGCGPLKGSTTPSNTVGMDVDLHRDDYASDEAYRDALAAIPGKVMAKKEELGLLMLERSATKGYHLAFTRRTELTQEENLRWASDLLGVEFDKGAKDITRVFFTTSNEDLLFLDDALFTTTSQERFLPSVRNDKGVDAQDDNGVVAQDVKEGEAPSVDAAHRFEPSPRHSSCEHDSALDSGSNCPLSVVNRDENLDYLGIPYSQIISKWWLLYNDGQEPVKSNRDVLTFELAVNLRHICGFDRETMDRVIPCYDGFPHEQKMKCIDSALNEKRTQMPKRLRDVLTELKKDVLNGTLGRTSGEDTFRALEEAEQEDELFYYRRIPQGAIPQGISDCIKATGAKMVMPVLAASCPAIGALATNVKVLIHGKETQLNMHSFVVGDAASGKGDLDDVVNAWMAEELLKNEVYYQQEAEFRAKKRAAKNAKSQPDEPHLPVRFLTMNNTVPNLAERLANTDGKHAFSYTPEADTVAQKWRSSMSDFSTMLRQSYDGSRYDREAKSAEATTVHIDHLLWNVCMCGTPDALYRVISNYTDGLLSRLIIAHTPDNTFAPLEDKQNLMTDKLRDRIGQIAHLLPLMQGTLNLAKLEERSREWVERVRREALKDDDRVMARARLRDHGTAMRMTTCLILCAVAEKLIRQHGLSGAEKQLKLRPSLTAEMAVKLQTPAMLDAYEVIAESLIDNDMLYFREKLENATATVGTVSDRKRMGKNDRIYDRLSDTFTFQQAMGAKGAGCTANSVRQMLKNWRKQGLIRQLDDTHYAKISSEH